MSSVPPKSSSDNSFARMARESGEASAQTKQRAVEATYDFSLGCQIVQRHPKEDPQEFFRCGQVDGGMVWSNIPYEVAVLLEKKLLDILNELNAVGGAIAEAVHESRPPL